jgi:4-alpha-glucanotransferase
MRDVFATRKHAGLLVPVFALRHDRDFGVGDTLAVKQAIDFCAAHGFDVLQTLPIHETIGDFSPYNPVTSRGLSPELFWLSPEAVPGLTEEMLDHFSPESWRTSLRAANVRHNAVQALKLQILLAASRAFQNDPAFDGQLREEFAEFQRSQQSWLEDYTLFRVLVREYEGNPNWNDWRPDHQNRERAEGWLARHPEHDYLHRLRQSFAYVQWIGFRQWKEVRQYADERGVFLMGEMSFGVSRHSVDVWAHPELFDLEWNMGTPPIVYFDTNKDSERWGQNWGLPPYRWENHRSSGFIWLRERLQGERQFFHICRLDHLRGYFRAYMFPWAGGAQHTEFATLTEEEILRRTGGRRPRFVPGADDNEVSAKMNEMQGRELMQVMREAAGDMFLFAEIMGGLPEYMSAILEELQIANLTFPLLERNADRSLRPMSSYRPLSLASYANHDHAPLAALYAHLRSEIRRDSSGTAPADLRNLLGFANWKAEVPETLNADLLAALQRALFQTPCLLAVLMSSDLLGIPQRFNLPGSYGQETWSERLEMPLANYAHHAVFGPRITTVVGAVRESGRSAKLVADS